MSRGGGVFFNSLGNVPFLIGCGSIMSYRYELSTKSKHFLVSFIFLLYRFKMDNHIALLKRLCRLCGDPVECKICNKLLDNALVLETPCMHLFCCECLTAHFETFGEPTVPCPTCQAPMHFKNITAPKDIFASVFLSTVMKCKACKVIVTVGEINHHVCVSCMSSIPNTN